MKFEELHLQPGQAAQFAYRDGKINAIVWRDEDIRVNGKRVEMYRLWTARTQIVSSLNKSNFIQALGERARKNGWSPTDYATAK